MEQGINNLTHGFLSTFSVNDLELVKDDIELVLNHHVKFLLAIETYDIINYYAPFIDKKILNYNIDAVKRGIIMYEKVFNSIKKNDTIYSQVLLTQQYASELFFIKNNFEGKLKDLKKEPKKISELKKEVQKIIDNASIENTTKNISLIQFEKLALFLVLKKKDSLVKHFYNFLKEKIIFDYDVNKLLGVDVFLDLDTTFVDYKLNNNHKKDILDVYRGFVSKVEPTNGISDVDYHKFLLNTHTDIDVIFSIIDYNNYYNCNTVFLYVSSARKTQKIANLFKEKKYFPKVHQVDNYNIIRSIPHIFLTKLLLEKYADDKQFDPIHVIEGLIENKQQIENKQPVENIQQKENKQRETVPKNRKNLIHAFDTIKDVVSSYYSSLDMHFYFDAYNEYKNLLKNSNEQIEQNANLDYADIIDRLLENTTIPNFDLESLVKNYHKKLFLSLLLPRNISKSLLNVRFGKDIIRNSFHHLPYLLFINSKITSRKQLSENLYHFLARVSDIPDNKKYIEPFMRELLQYIHEYIVKYLNKQYFIEDYVYSSLIDKCLFVLLSKKDTADNSCEEEILNELFIEKATLETVLSRSDIDGGHHKNNLKTIGTKHYLIREINYVTLWLLRRNKKNDDAIKFGEKMIHEYSDDGRFYHGLSLAYIDKLYELLSDELSNFYEIQRIIKLTLETLLPTAIFYYEKLLENDDRNWKDNYIKELILKSQSAIYNTKTDLSIRLYELLRNKNKFAKFEILTSGRISISKNKDIIQKLGKEYKDYPICNITEAELEYYEALYYKDIKEYKLAKEKIKCALRRCNYCRNTDIIYERFSVRIKAIEKLYKKLAMY